MSTLIVNSALARLFVEGGAIGMGVITLLLAFMLFAAWKFPSWVKEIGIAALAVSILWTLIGLYQAFGAHIQHPDISPVIIFAGYKVALISTIYGLIVYLLSLVIRIIQKPRI